MSSIRLSGTSSGYYDLTVPAVAGTNSIDLSNLVVKDSSGNIGINSTPTAALDVRRTDANGKIAEFHQNGGYGLEIHSSQSRALIGSGYLQDFVIDTDAGSGGTESMRITKDGAMSLPKQPMVETYYTNATQHGAYNAGTSRNVTVCKPGGVRFYTGNNMYDSGTGRYTAQYAGTYYASWAGSQYNSGVTNYFMIRIRKNGSVQKDTYFNKTNLGSWVHLSGFAYFQLAVGDYIDFYSNNDSTGGDRGGFDVNTYTCFAVRMVG